MKAATRRRVVWSLAALCAVASACRSPREAGGPYSGGATAAIRNEVLATNLVERAANAMPRDPERAEELLREALEADLFHAKAHNNLGVLLLSKADLYGAAQEFEWAKKLLPGHPEPRLNLAITLERAGQVQGAEASYASALEVYPGYMPAIQGAARLAVAEGRRDADVAGWLDEIALRGESEQWRAWAKKTSSEAELDR